MILLSIAESGHFKTYPLGAKMLCVQETPGKQNFSKTLVYTDTYLVIIRNNPLKDKRNARTVRKGKEEEKRAKQQPRTGGRHR